MPYHGNDESGPLQIPTNNHPVDEDSIAAYQKSITSHWVDNEVRMPHADGKYNDKVIWRSKNVHGSII